MFWLEGLLGDQQVQRAGVSSTLSVSRSASRSSSGALCARHLVRAAPRLCILVRLRGRACHGWEVRERLTLSAFPSNLLSSSGARGAAPEHVSEADRQEMSWLRGLAGRSTRVRAPEARRARQVAADAGGHLPDAAAGLSIPGGGLPVRRAPPAHRRGPRPARAPLPGARLAAPLQRGCPVSAARLPPLRGAAVQALPRGRPVSAARPSCVKVLPVCEEHARSAAGALHECARTDAPRRLRARAVASHAGPAGP